MSKFDFKFTQKTPSRDDMEILAWLSNRIVEMDTSYRKEAIDAASWARYEYDAIPEERLNNLDLFKTGLSRTVVNHRLSMMYDNPSESIYKAVEDSDQHKVDILTQLDKYDKNISRFTAVDQDLSQTAEVEGTSIALIDWHEETVDGETVGTYSTITEKISLKDFYWDPAGINLNGGGSFVCNDVAYVKVYSLSDFRRLFNKKPYKNIFSVMPNAGVDGHTQWRELWEEGRDEKGDYVSVLTYYCKNFWNGRNYVDKQIEVANGVLIYYGEMRVPYIQNQKWLPFSKRVGIPTGAFCGLGIPVVIRHPQEVLDRMLTMAEAQAELSVNPVMFYSSTGELLPEEITYYPGAAYPYKGTGQGISRDIEFVKHPDLTNGATYIIDKMLQFVTMITGVDIQALLDTSGELAIQTQNKREVQEKILKMSVIWNETHGLYDLAVIRLAYMQKFYPSQRIHRIVSPNGQQTTNTDFPRISVEGFTVREETTSQGTVTRLEKVPGSYSSLSITPEDVRFNVDVIVESSQIGAGIDTVKQNKFDKMMAGVLTNPAEAQSFDWNSVAKERVRMAGFKESKLIRNDLISQDSTEHPARKEFKAILLSDSIPFNPILPDDYNPEDFIFVYRDLMKLPEYKKIASAIKERIHLRLAEHIKNFSDPFFKDRLNAERQAEAEQLAMEQSMAAEAPKGSPGEPKPTEGMDLAGRTRSAASKIGASSREAIRSN